MITQVPFIDREVDLARIDQAIRARNTRRVIGIQANGGVGKTRLLQEIQHLYKDTNIGQALHLLVAEEILDFDDRANQIPYNVGRRIAQMLGAEFFKPYLRGLFSYHKLEKAEVHYARLLESRRMNDQEFIRCFNQATRKRRAVLLLDTTESFTTDIGYLLNWIQQSENTVWILVGRPNSEMIQWVCSRQSEEFIFWELEPLSPEASRKYIFAKQRSLHITLEQELVEKLIILAQGRPILIDLAVELRVKKNLSDWLDKVDSLLDKNLSAEKKAQKRQEFESELVASIAEVRTPIDWLILALAHVYPLNVDLLGKLLDPFSDALPSFQEVQQHVFVKFLHDGQIMLHDEMRRMIQTYVWPEIDPSNEQRKEFSKIAAEYLEKKEEYIKSQLAELKASQEQLLQQAQEDEELELSTFLQRQTLERELWVVQESLLYHALYIDLAKGIAVFARLFDEATQAYTFDRRELFYKQMEAYNFDQMSPDLQYAFNSRKIRYLNDVGQFGEAQALATAMLSGDLKIEQRLDLLTLSGRSYELSHNWLKALEQYEAALKICESHPELARWKGTLLNNLGRVTREMRRTDEALSYYRQTLFIAEDQVQIAATLNSIGYVWSLQGRYRGAHQYCRKSLLIYKRLQRDRDIGTTLATIGEVFRNQKDYGKAIEYYDSALPYFKRANDLIWLARLYSRRGAVRRLQREYSDAVQDLETSLRYNIREEQPWTYHVLGCVFWNQKKWAEAEKEFQRSDTLAREIGDIRTQVNNLVGYAELYFDRWEDLKDPADLERVKEKAEELETLLQQGYGFDHHYGRMKRALADVYFYQGHYDLAFENYKEAYTLLGSRQGGYGRHTDFEGEVRWLTERIMELATVGKASLAISWCQDFRRHWETVDIPMMHRELLLSMCDICEIDIKLRDKGIP